MKYRHFEALRPVCPVCRAANTPGFPLRIAQVGREEANQLVEGILHCSNPNCLREFPIVDGVPLIVANLREYISQNILAIYSRGDLSDVLESVLGDCCGANSTFDQTRQHLSSYAWDHYADLDPDEPEAEPQPGAMLRNLRVGLQLTEPIPQGPVVELGCSVGRSCFALAERHQDLVLGVDWNFAMLRLAAEVLRHGVVRYPRRRTGLVYERREFPAQFPQSEQVDFWACDAVALPFAAQTFSLAVNLNVLDSVVNPRELLMCLARVLTQGGKAILTCPYDWSPAATPVESWLGGHSQRSPMKGSPEAVLQTLLTPGGHPAAIGDLKLAAERDDLSWHVRLHDRSTMNYRVHLVVAERTPRMESRL